MKLDNTVTKNIELCFTPALLPYVNKNVKTAVVVVDVLRATTAICTAFHNGVKEIIPVASYMEAKKYKSKGFLVAAERNGIKAKFADFGNSPFNFTPEKVKDKTIVYSTTNGTQIIQKTSRFASDVFIGAFINLNSLCEFLDKKNECDKILIVCSGWKNRFNLEDSVCGGAISETLLNSGNFSTACDSVIAAIELWKAAKPDLISFADKCAHRHRLKKLGLDDVIDYSFSINLVKAVPVYKNNRIININV